MLCFLLSIEHLAEAIQQIFEKEAEDAPDGHAANIIPGSAAIRGALQACVDQTAAFNWRLIILAVTETLDLKPITITPMRQYPSVPEFLIRGLTTMFPLVQHLPDDRLIQVNLSSSNGVTLVLVWAHWLLGLTVVIYQYDHRGNGRGEKQQFGTGSAQVIIEVDSDSRPREGIVLLSVDDVGNEDLFRLASEPDTKRIDILSRELLGNYGHCMVSAVASEFLPDVKAVVDEMAHAGMGEVMK